MTAIFWDGFDHYTITDLGQKWQSPGGSMITGRFGTGQAIRNPGNITRSIPSAGQYICGVAVRKTAATDQYLIRFGETSIYHTSIMMNAAGFIEVQRNTTVIATSTGSFSTNVWLYLECKTTIADTTGTAEVRINGVPVVFISGADTRNANTGIINFITLYSPGCDYDDLYIFDTNGSFDNDFAGNVRVIPLYPTSSGTFTQWTPVNAVSNYLCVNEVLANDDANYNQVTASGSVDSFIMQDLAFVSGTIFGIQKTAQARQDDAGLSQISLGIVMSGTARFGTPQTLGASYVFLTEILEKNPFTTGTWTLADINALESAYREEI